jgi:capsular polysaccharide biosynthesis protein
LKSENALVIDSGTVITEDNELVMDTFNSSNALVKNSISPVDKKYSKFSPPASIPRFLGKHLLIKKIGVSNYSHYVLEMFTRALLVKRKFPQLFSDLRLIVPISGIPLDNVVRRSLAQVGAEGRALETDNEFVGRFEELFFITGISQHPKWIHPAAIREIETFYKVPPVVTENSVPIFVTRQDAGKRRLKNEDQVFEACQKVLPNIVRVSCTGLQFDEQIQTFSNASIVIAVMGGSFGNIVFCPRNIKCVCIGPGQFSDLFFCNLAFQKSMEYYELRGTPESDRPHSAFNLDCKGIETLISIISCDEVG